MKPNWKVLVENIQSLKSSVEGTLNDEFKDFNDVINEETSYDIANSNVLIRTPLEMISMLLSISLPILTFTTTFGYTVKSAM